MKRIAAVLTVLLIAAFCFTACSGVTVGALKSDIFKDEEYEEAVACVQEYFKNFEGCEMKKIEYAGDDVVKAEAENRGVDVNNIIVLKSTFKTDGEDHHNGLEPDTTYEDYTWTLVREGPGAPWEHKDHGYG